MTFPPDVPPRWSTRNGSAQDVSRSRRRLVVIACLVLVALLTACGSGGDAEVSGSTTTTLDDSETETTVDPDPEPHPGPDETTTTTTVETTTTVPDPGPDPDPDPGPGPGPDPLPDPGRGLTDDEVQYVDDLAAAMDDMDFPATVDQQCVARVWVSSIGGDRLEAAGLSPEDFVNRGPSGLDIDRPTAEAMHRGSLACGLTPDALVQSIVGDQGSCPGLSIPDQLFEDLMVSAYMDEYDEALDDQLDALLEGCS